MTGLPLSEWRDFYVTVGTASGAIVGAAFVVASLTANQEKRELGINGFITPTAVHLGGVLVASAILIVPSPTTLFLAAFFGFAGLAGILYGSIIISVRVKSLKLAIEDRFFYLLAPPLAYAVMVVSAWRMWTGGDYALVLLAVSLMSLLIIGMRNLWDMATFMILTARTAPEEQITRHDGGAN